MPAHAPTLIRPLLVLALCLAMLGLLVQPVLAVAHEQHEAAHLLSVEKGRGEQGPAANEAEGDDAAPGTLDGLLHAFDCCLHATAMPASLVALKMPAPGTHVPDAGHSVLRPAPVERLLRPPIEA